ncbi:MAG: VRR-NUC domain-containing protein [bacterium]|nr:VRR-NUC domain-containing protein [bacterium]
MNPAQQTHLNLDAVENWPSEKLLQKAVSKWLREQGCIVLHVVGFFAASAGWPDCLVVAPDGKFLMIELKTQRGTLRPMQTTFIEKAHRAGHNVIVARTMTEVRNAFANLYAGVTP